MATLKEGKSHEMGLHEEQLKGRTQQRFFSVDESENLTYFHSFDVDTSKSASIDALDMTPREINREIRELMEKGIGNITVDNPMSRHGVGVGILNRLNLTFSDSLGYFGCGLIDGPNVHIKGRVGWSCAENMMAGTVVIDKNAGSTFGAAIRGGDLVCKGSVGARTGIDQKGGTIIVGGKTGEKWKENHLGPRPFIIDFNKISKLNKLTQIGFAQSYRDEMGFKIINSRKITKMKSLKKINIDNNKFEFEDLKYIRKIILDPRDEFLKKCKKQNNSIESEYDLGTEDKKKYDKLNREIKFDNYYSYHKNWGGDTIDEILKERSKKIKKAN